MLRLVFYSGGQDRSRNRFLHEHVVALAGKKKRKRMTYIPYHSEYSQEYYSRFVRRYRSYGITDFFCLPVDQKISAAEKRKALRSDIIYIAGGNTYYILHHLQQNRFLAPLRQFANEGRVLAGLSAGGILMTPNIALAGVPTYEADQNLFRLKDFRSLNLVNFEFSPHHRQAKRYVSELLAYSKKTKNPIFSCADGGGIVVDGKSMTLYGDVHLFQRGVRTQLTKDS